MDKALLDLIDKLAAGMESDNKRKFFCRVWKQDQTFYQRRVRALGFEGLGTVLDAGCGFGQWSAALATLNDHVVGLDYDRSRATAADQIANFTGLTNLSFASGSVEELPFAAGLLDGVFSYGVIFLTDYRKTLREYYRTLRHGGILYFCGNGLGWYLHNILDTHNDAADFSSRDMAIDALRNSITYYGANFREAGSSIVMTSSIVRKELIELGFEILAMGTEGNIRHDKHGCQSFYAETLYGHENVWEVLCRKVAT